MNKKLDIEGIKRIPIMDVAERLGMDLMRTGPNGYAMRDENDHRAASSLQIDVTGNKWKRFSGIEQGGVSQGSVINLVMHYNDCDFTDALEWFKSEFPSCT